MSPAPLELSRAEILGFRRRVAALDKRLPMSADSLRQAAWAGLSDSMPRAAILSIHARVAGTKPSTWEDPSLVQVWGPRFSAYVVAKRDLAVFTLGRHPDEPTKQRRAVSAADRLEAHLAGRKMPYGEAGHALGVDPNRLRYGTTTGRILIRWDGARQPTVWTVPAPDVDPQQARLELARRYAHVLGPGTAEGFGDWAGIRAPRATSIFDALKSSMTEVRTPVGAGWILTEDEPAFRARPASPAPARLLPSGDTWFLYQGDSDRELLVPDAARRSRLWTPRVWPGAVLVDGEIVGTWRRSQAALTIEAWRDLSAAERAAVEAEAASLPLPGLERQVVVSWVA